MPIVADILQRAIHLYFSIAYAGKSVPEAAQQRAKAILELPPGVIVAENLLEKDAANSLVSYALRLGQPMYPFMKLMIEPAPCATPETAKSYLLRVDSHDRHLHAPAGSPDAEWLATIRASNKELTEKIEAAWSGAGLPTFKDFLRKQLEMRKAQRGSKFSEGIQQGTTDEHG